MERMFVLADIIQFKSRAQIEHEEKERIHAEWKEWLAFEEQCLKQELAKEENTNYDVQMTHEEIVIDFKQYLSPEDVNEIEAFDSWLEKHENHK